MPVAVSIALWVIAVIGLAAVAIQALLLARHARGVDPAPRGTPLVSVRRDVTWRGNRLRVLAGTRVAAPAATPGATTGGAYPASLFSAFRR